MQNVDMVGCRRRRAYDFQEALGRRVDFTCIGQNIPCTVRIGDNLFYNATFNAGNNHISKIMVWNDLIELNLTTS